MTIWEIKSCIASRVKKLNELTGENYVTEFGHGGVLLFKWTERNCPSGGRFGDASIRRKAPEMLSYLDGLLSGLTGIKY